MNPSKPVLALTRLELLEACNRISLEYGGRALGCVQGYRNQHLIAVELHDTSRWRPVGALLGRPDLFDEDFFALHWIRCGFCQSTITRAPDGGFSLTIDYDVLCRCRTPDHVAAYFETWLGALAEREEKLCRWERLVDAARIAWPDLAAAIRLTRQRKEREDAAVADAV